MLRVSELNNKAVGLVGWQQPTKTGSPVINAANLVSRSGLYFQNGSGLVTIENIKAAVPDADMSDEQLNTYLANLSKAGLSDLAHQIFTEDDFIENKRLYAYPLQLEDTIANGSDFVGFELSPVAGSNMTVLINQLILDFDAATDVKILLFNSQNRSLIDFASITVSAEESTEEQVSWELADNKGTWYIGYLTKDLGANAINRRRSNSTIRTDFQSCDMRPIRVPGWDTETLFDLDAIEYTSDTYGLNFELSAYDDYTDLVLNNEKRFAKALQLHVAAQVLDLLSNTARSNRNERLSKANSVFELSGNKFNENFPEHTGLLSKLKMEVGRLKKTYVRINPITVGQL